MMEFGHFAGLGDSILSDDFPGPGLGAASLLLTNDDMRFPDFRGRDLRTRRKGLTSNVVARTGWRVKDLLSRLEGLPPVRVLSLVVVTVGGNDLLHWVMEQTPAEQGLSQLETDLLALKARLDRLYPRRVTRWGNIYDPTDGTGRFQSGREVPTAPALLEQANALLKRLFDRDVVDLHGHFLGHGIRHADEDYQHHDARDASGWFKMDIEPNPRGASEIRRCFWEAIP
ncbi:MAG: SGNH/GDSL hydrolase family protein [Vulcanimicrobiota bacterium]